MKKIITIICDTEIPIKHLLNDKDFEIYEAVGNEDIFTMIKKEEENKKARS